MLSGEIFLNEKMSVSVLGKLLRGKNDVPVSPIEQVSNRELEVFQMLGEGKPSRQIKGFVHMFKNWLTTVARASFINRATTTETTCFFERLN